MTSTNDNGIQTLAGAARRHPCSGRSIQAWICNSLSDAMRMFCVAHCDVLRTDCTKVSYFQGHLLQLHHNPATHGGLPRARTRKHAHFRMVSCSRDTPPQPSPAPSACSSSPASCICCHCCSLSLSLPRLPAWGAPCAGSRLLLRERGQLWGQQIGVCLLGCWTPISGLPLLSGARFGVSFFIIVHRFFIDKPAKKTPTMRNK